MHWLIRLEVLYRLILIIVRRTYNLLRKASANGLLSAMSSQEGKNYIFGDQIGSGSYSTVFKAYQKGPDRNIVAIKVIPKSITAVDNLINEIKLLKSLKHKHIVEMKDFFWDSKNIMIVMEFCDGGDLSSFIKRRSRLPEIVCKRFLQQLADALHYLRSRNISHMDLKPSNLLLSSGQILKLADFGFAQYLSCEEKKHSLRGSPLYMAPEMLLEHKYDAKVDLWSVGVIMYECLFGRAPYSSRTFEELAEKIKSKAPIEIPSGSTISAGCADLLKKLLVHDPEQRISFESFFKSEYLDLEHMPCEASMEKAINLVTSAIKHDVENKPSEAFKFYCDALQYFVPLINAETDENRKVTLRNKVDQYVKRAEELKVQLHGGLNDVQQSSSGPREDVYHRLMNLCAPTPKLLEALDIGHVAEQYLAEGNHVAALSSFQLSIGIIIGFLANEPAGVRKDLLHRQTQRWLQLAEDAKRTSTLQTYPESKKEASTVGKEMCLIQ